MEKAITFNFETGEILIGDTISLRAGQQRKIVENLIVGMTTNVRDHENGYIWLDITGLIFGGHPAGMSLCFINDQFQQAQWSVTLPNQKTEGGWPTREAIDQEINFVRDFLSTEYNLDSGEWPNEFVWGQVFCDFDPKGFLASNGIRFVQK